MKTLIYFNLKDKPENMGQSQLTDDVKYFAEQLKNAKIEEKQITFDIEDRRGYAVTIVVPEDFEN